MFTKDKMASPILDTPSVKRAKNNISHTLRGYVMGSINIPNTDFRNIIEVLTPLRNKTFALFHKELLHIRQMLLGSIGSHASLNEFKEKITSNMNIYKDENIVNEMMNKPIFPEELIYLARLYIKYLKTSRFFFMSVLSYETKRVAKENIVGFDELLETSPEKKKYLSDIYHELWMKFMSYNIGFIMINIQSTHQEVSVGTKRSASAMETHMETPQEEDIHLTAAEALIEMSNLN